MTYVRKYTKEQLIALARERGSYLPEDATDEELKVVERRLSAERGWIAEPPPARLSDEDKRAALEALGRRFYGLASRPDPDYIADMTKGRPRPVPVDPMNRPVQAQDLPSTTRVAMAHAGVVPVVIARGAQAVEAQSLHPQLWVVPVE
jgi:hypothetical protein